MTGEELIDMAHYMISHNVSKYEIDDFAENVIEYLEKDTIKNTN